MRGNAVAVEVCDKSLRGNCIGGIFGLSGCVCVCVWLVGRAEGGWRMADGGCDGMVCLGCCGGDRVGGVVLRLGVQIELLIWRWLARFLGRGICGIARGFRSLVGCWSWYAVIEKLPVDAFESNRGWASGC